MKALRFQQFLAIAFTFVIAMVLMIIPLQRDLHWLRPDWVTLVLIYWVLTLPRSVGVFSGTFVGLLLDIQGGMLLGQYALVMAVVAFCTNLLRSRLRLFLMWQRAMIVLLLVGFSRMILLWEQWLLGHPPTTLLYWSSTFTSFMVWPLVQALLQAYHRRIYGITSAT